MAGNAPKRVVKNSWVSGSTLPYPMRQISPFVGTVETDFSDDPIAGTGNPNTLIKSSGLPNYLGRYTVKTTSGTVVPSPRQEVTTYTVDFPEITSGAGELIRDFSDHSIAIDRKQSCDGAPIAKSYWITAPRYYSALTPSVPGCAYKDGLLRNWFPAQPFSTGSPAFFQSSARSEYPTSSVAPSE